MAVRSVAAKNAQNLHVVRAVQWASSKTIKDVLSVNVENYQVLKCHLLRQVLACQWMGIVMRMRKVGMMAAVNVTVIMDGRCVR